MVREKKRESEKGVEEVPIACGGAAWESRVFRRVSVCVSIVYWTMMLLLVSHSCHERSYTGEASLGGVGVLRAAKRLMVSQGVQAAWQAALACRPP